MEKVYVSLCSRMCNDCALINDPNSRMLTKIFNELYNMFGEGVYKIIQANCGNMTTCYDCRIDDFVHEDNCRIVALLEQEARL